MLKLWSRLQGAHWLIRWPIKLAIFGAILFVVLFPNPVRFHQYLQNLQRLNDLSDPCEPALAPLAAKFDFYVATLGINPRDSQAVLKAVERFVVQEIPYSWDWDNWGMADYIPTVKEVIERKTEDCDGRAVLAAALLRHRGIEAHLVGDPRHIWVSTPRGQTMSPMGPPVFSVQNEQLKVRWREMLDMIEPMSYGVAVFPLRRELILLVALWMLLRRPTTGRWRSLAGLLLMLCALMVIRYAGADPLKPDSHGLLTGLALLAVVPPLLMLPRLGIERWPVPDRLRRRLVELVRERAPGHPSAGPAEAYVCEGQTYE